MYQQFTIDYSTENVFVNKENIKSDCNSIEFRNEHATKDATLKINGSVHSRTLKPGNAVCYGSESPLGIIVTSFDIEFPADGTGLVHVTKEYKQLLINQFPG